MKPRYAQALLTAAVAAVGAFVLTEGQRGFSALGAGVAVALFTAARVWYVGLVPLVVLPFVRGEAREWLSLALLCSSVPALAYVRWPDILLDARLLAARFVAASGGWLLAMGAFALWLDGPTWRLLLVPLSLVTLAILLRHASRELGPALEPGGVLGPSFRGLLTLLGFALATWLAVALSPLADAFRRGLWYPLGNPDLVLRMPPLPPPPWRPPPRRIELPVEFRGEPEPEDDPKVLADTQSWCLMHHRRGGLVHSIRPRSLRWEQLRFFYREGDKAAACTMERLIRRALPERGSCTLEHVYDLALECQIRPE